MKPYSMDLRERVIAAVDRQEGSQRQIARRFGISLSAVRDWLRRRRLTGSIAPKPHGGGHPPALDPTHRQQLQELIRQRPDATLDELTKQLGVACHRMAIWRTLRKLRISRKQKVLHAQERDTPRVERRRRTFRRRLAEVSPKRLVFVDETGAHTAMTRTHGRAPIGQRVEGAVPGHWESVTLVAGMRLAGVVSPMAFTGAVNTPLFESYVEQILVPELHPGDVVVWDKLTPHQSGEARRLLRRAGAALVPLPPYSPDLTPIEKMFSKVKEALRSAGARTTATVYAAMDQALKAVHGPDIRGWFQSCGLCLTQT
jgi:transposase